jgi:GNAT superfamily N-acetyltransferase
MKPATPIVSHLGSRSKQALLRHFQALGPDDRRLRFGHAISDEGLAAYVAKLDLSRDGVYVVRDGRQRILGAAHVALAGNRAEVGVSVLADARNQGLGTRLLRQAADFARSRQAVRIDMHFLAENKGMQQVARKCGMQIQTQAGESEAWLMLPGAEAGPPAPPRGLSNEIAARRAA